MDFPVMFCCLPWDSETPTVEAYVNWLPYPGSLDTSGPWSSLCGIEVSVRDRTRFGLHCGKNIAEMTAD